MSAAAKPLRNRLTAAVVAVGALAAGGMWLSAILLEYDADVSSVFKREPYQDLAWLLPVCGAAIVLIWLISGRSFRRLNQASRQAASVGPQNVETRLSASGLPGEVVPLVDAVNGALDRLTQAYTAEQRFLSDAAHQLRTPLTGLSLRLQRAKRDGTADWDELLGEVDHIDALIGRLLRLARYEAARGPGAAGVDLPQADLAKVAHDVVATMRPVAEQAGREIALVCPACVPVRADSDAMREALLNLVDNAFRHGRGRVVVRVDVLIPPVGESRVRIAVADDGPGIAPGFVARAFDRFSVADPEGTGHGLGLAIVREIATANGGAAAVSATVPHTVLIELPLDPGA